MDPLRKLARELIAEGVIKAKPKPKTVARKRKLVGIREAIDYVAFNADEDLGSEDTGFEVTIVMVAHLFDREPSEVAEMVARKRDKTGLLRVGQLMTHCRCGAQQARKP